MSNSPYSYNFNEVQRPKVDVDSLIEQRMTDCGYANILYECLVEQIRDFEKTLQPNQEIGAYLSSFGNAILIQIENIGYHNPFFIVFYGKNIQDNRKVQLVQHTTQLNVLFTSIDLEKDEKREARRIGFQLGNDTE